MGFANTTTYVERTIGALHAYGTSVASGNYTTGGIAFTVAGADWITDQPLLWAEVQGIAGYVYVFRADTQKVMIFQCAGSGNPLVELSAAALPAGVTGDTITFSAVAKGLI